MQKLSMMVCAACLASASATARAQSNVSLPLVELLAAPNLECQFVAGNRVALGGDAPEVTPIGWPAAAVVYTDIDIGRGRASQGDAEVGGEVRLIPTNSGLHFYEFDAAGDLSIATVFPALDGNGRYRAVLSRHKSDGGDPVTAQLYGSCAALEAGADMATPAADATGAAGAAAGP